MMFHLYYVYCIGLCVDCIYVLMNYMLHELLRSFVLHTLNFCNCKVKHGELLHSAQS